LSRAVADEGGGGSPVKCLACEEAGFLAQLSEVRKRRALAEAAKWRAQLERQAGRPLGAPAMALLEEQVRGLKQRLAEEAAQGEAAAAAAAAYEELARDANAAFEDATSALESAEAEAMAVQRRLEDSHAAHESAVAALARLEDAREALAEEKASRRVAEAEAEEARAGQAAAEERLAAMMTAARRDDQRSPDAQGSPAAVLGAPCAVLFAPRPAATTGETSIAGQAEALALALVTFAERLAAIGAVRRRWGLSERVG
jgi:hypothetical protein